VGGCSAAAWPSAPGDVGADVSVVKRKKSPASGARAGVIAGVASEDRAPGVVVPDGLNDDGAKEI
jgi:hypothetical protein